MALLRLSDGRVFTAIEDINAQLSPMKIGAFGFSEAERTQVDAMDKPLSTESAKAIVAMLDPELRASLAAEGLGSWRLGNVVENADGSFGFYLWYENGETGTGQQSAEDMRQYRNPHRDDVEDIHFVFSGSIIKGAQLDNGLQGVVYVQEGEWIRVGSKAVNWPVFPAGKSTIGLSFFSKPATSTLKSGRESFPDLEILAGMRF
jgi:hypothetical protein